MKLLNSEVIKNALKEMAAGARKNSNFAMAQAYAEAYAMIDTLPAAAPAKVTVERIKTPVWHDVADAPEVGTEALVMKELKNGTHNIAIGRYNGREINDGWTCAGQAKIIKWMELPEVDA